MKLVKIPFMLLVAFWMLIMTAVMVPFMILGWLLGMPNKITNSRAGTVRKFKWFKLVSVCPAKVKS